MSVAFLIKMIYNRPKQLNVNIQTKLIVIVCRWRLNFIPKIYNSNKNQTKNAAYSGILYIKISLAYL